MHYDTYTYMLICRERTGTVIYICCAIMCCGSRPHLLSAASVLPKWQISSSEAHTVMYRVAPGDSTTSTRTRPPMNTVCPTAALKVRGFSFFLGSSIFTCM